jgi:muramoyltetrapeptide carboxypeptidase
MHKPRAVRAGDRIAIVATASGCTRDSFDQGVAELRRLGFDPVYDDSVFERGTFSAGPAQMRAEAFQRAWTHPEIAAIIALRGGYGSVELLPFLDGLPATPPKLFVGYSDNTSLMTWLTQRGVPVLHGPMIDGRLSAGPRAYDEASFLALLRDGEGLVLQPPGVAAVKPGQASGVLTGGTLTQLAASLGTPYAFDPPQDCLLFLEDVNERPYRLHRLLTQLRLAGILQRAAGIVFGEMRECDESASSTTTGARVTARMVVDEFAADCPGPVVTGFPSGHTTGPCWTVPFGVTCRLAATPHPSLIVEDSPVE